MFLSGSSILLSTITEGGGGADFAHESIRSRNFDRFVTFVQHGYVTTREFYESFSPPPAQIVTDYLKEFLLPSTENKLDIDGLAIAVQRICKEDTLPASLIEDIKKYEKKDSDCLLGGLLRHPNRRDALAILKILVHAHYPITGEVVYFFPKDVHNTKRGTFLHLAASIYDADALQTIIAGLSAFAQSKEALAKLIDSPDELGRSTLQSLGQRLRLARTKSQDNPSYDQLSNILLCSLRLLQNGANPWSSNTEREQTNELRSESFLYAYLSVRLALGLGKPNEVMAAIDGEIAKRLRHSDAVQFQRMLKIEDTLQSGNNYQETTEKMITILSSGCSLALAAAAFEVCKDCVENRASGKRPITSETALAPVLGELLDIKNKIVLRELLHCIDSSLYKNRNNPWEPELFAAFTGQAVKEDRKLLDQLTQAVTAPYNFLEKGLDPLPWNNVYLLEETGALTHSHRLFKAYTITFPQPHGRPKCLLELYGYTFIGESDTLGKVYRKKTANYTIDIFRAGYAITALGLGTYVVRNSSPVFGRDKFESSAYYSVESLKESYLRFLRFQRITAPLLHNVPVDNRSHFKPIMDIKFHKSPHLVEKALKLARLIRSELHSCALWLCNLDQENTCIQGKDGLLFPKDNQPYVSSPGQEHLVNLARWYNLRRAETDGYLKIAWIEGFGTTRAKTALHYHTFVGADGGEHHTLELSPKVVDCLAARLRGSKTKETLTPIHSFFRYGLEQGTKVQLFIIDERRRT